MDKETRELLESIAKLEGEGFLKFNKSKSQVIEFIENNMEYIVYGKEGTITKYTSCRLACGMTLYQLHNFVDKELKSDEGYSKEEQDKVHKYFLENHLRMNWFNFVTWKKLQIVFLNPSDYSSFKFNKEEELK